MNRGVLDGKTLRYERQLAHPIDRVWHVLTDEAETAHWFPAAIVGPREVGAKVTFRFGPKPASVIGADFQALIEAKQTAFEGAGPELFEGTIEVFDPPRVFAFDWAGDKARFELTAHGDRTALVFLYTFAEGPFADAATGWHVTLDFLARLLGDGTRPTTRADFEELEGLYKRAMP